MLDFLRKLTGTGQSPDFQDQIRRGAQIVDVRSADEFRRGHVAGSMNIPLPNLNRDISKLRKDRPIITCCASGMRSAAAKSALEAQGFVEVVNGGGWASLQRQLEHPST